MGDNATNEILTICSVSYKSRSLLDLNWSLTNKLNDIGKFRWVVVENTENDHEEKVPSTDNRFLLVEGVHTEKVGMYASTNHAAGLNKALGHISTRFVLFLDPDFYVVRCDWIESVIAYMQEHGLSFFGSPYYPDRRYEYRYFPSAICMFVDLERVPLLNLDFSPEIDTWKAVNSIELERLAMWVLTGRKPDHNGALLRQATVEMARQAFIDRMLRRLLWRYSDLLDVTSARDTGYRVYKAFSGMTNHRSECLMPVWRNPLYDNTTPMTTRLKLQVMPERLSIYPKRKGYSVPHGFHMYGYPDLVGNGWEEYIWQSKPFGFHVRGASFGLSQVDTKQLATVVDEFDS